MAILRPPGMPRMMCAAFCQVGVEVASGTSPRCVHQQAWAASAWARQTWRARGRGRGYQWQEPASSSGTQMGEPEKEWRERLLQQEYRRRADEEDQVADSMFSETIRFFGFGNHEEFRKQ